MEVLKLINCYGFVRSPANEESPAQSPARKKFKRDETESLFWVQNQETLQNVSAKLDEIKQQINIDERMWQLQEMQQEMQQEISAKIDEIKQQHQQEIDMLVEKGRKNATPISRTISF